MFKVTSRGAEKQGGESKFTDMETINDIFAEAAAKGSDTLCQEDGRWINDIAPHLRGIKLHG